MQCPWRPRCVPNPRRPHRDATEAPTLYSHAEIELACKLAAALNRGKLVLAVNPKPKGTA